MISLTKLAICFTHLATAYLLNLIISYFIEALNADATLKLNFRIFNPVTSFNFHYRSKIY